MNDATLLHELDLMSHDATGNNSTFIAENEELLDRYYGNPYGDEEPERSKVVSNDVMDVVEADMPSLARIFLGPSEILKFKHNKAKEDDVEEAEQKTKYVNWQIREQAWSFQVLHGFIKNAEIQKISVLKYYIDETTEVEEHKKTGLSNDELAMFEESLKGEDVKSIDVVREEEGETEENTVVVKVERTVKAVKCVNVELENFRMTKNAASKDTAALVGDVSLTTRGELMALGFERDLVDSLSLAGSVEDKARLKQIRDEKEGGADEDSIGTDWANEEVEVEDLYPTIDYDDDGIAERRHIMRSGDVVLVNEVFNHVPYAVMPAILMPHKAVGMSRAEITAPTARVKTAILRGVNDNIYAVNYPRMGANKNVNMDDLLVIRQNGVIRSNTDTPIANDLMPVTVPYIGDKALQVVQYWDQARAQSTGSLMASQGLDADALSKETATRFTGVEKASTGKVELVARVMAETGFRQLYEGVAWLDANFQDSETEIAVLGEELKVNPKNWKYKHSVVSKVGLGAGDDEKKLQTMTGLWTIHQQLQANNSPMTDEVKRFNIVKNMVNAAGEPEVSEYFNNPEREEELVTAQNEILTNIVQQLQVQVQELQNPLAEAETIRAQAKLIEAQGKQSLDAATMVQNQRQFNQTLEAKQEQSTQDLAKQITELELKYNTQVDAEFKSNEAMLVYDPAIGDFASAAG